MLNDSSQFDPLPKNTTLDAQQSVRHGLNSADSFKGIPNELMPECIAESATKVLMLVNRTAGSSAKKQVADDATKELNKAGFVVEQVENTDQLREALRACADNLRCVVAVGGDGTLGAALNETPEGTPLTILPAGTENLMAGYLHRNRRASDLVRLVRDGLTVRLDAGVANGRLFTLLASAGFDADVVRRVHATRITSKTGNINHLSYAWPICRAIGGYRYPRIRISGEYSDGTRMEPVEGTWLFGVNLPRYASGLKIAPNASGLDGLLDLCVMKRGQVIAGLWYLWHILRHRHERLPSVSTARVTSCLVESLGDEEVPFQIDGDPGGVLPLHLSVAPRRLRVLISPSAAKQIGRNSISS